MALIDSLRQASQMGANPDAVLQQVAKQNQGTSLAASIAKAQASGAQSKDILNEIIKQNSQQPQAPTIDTSPQAMQSNLQKQDTGFVSGLGARTAEQQMAGAQTAQQGVETGAADINKGGDTLVQGGAENTVKGSAKITQGIAEGALGGTAGFLQSLFAPVTAVVSPVIAKAGQVVQAETPTIIAGLRKLNPNAAAAYDALAPEVKAKLAPHLDTLVSQAQEFQQKHPNATQLASNFAQTVAGAVGGAEGESALGDAGKTSVSDAIQSAKENASNFVNKDLSNVPSDVSNAVSSKVSNIKNAISPQENDLQAIKETISPKPTAKEAQLATEQGRLYKGNEPTLLKSGTEDKVAASDQQLKSTMTINRLIPDAAKMDEPTLYKALDEKVSDTAEALKPEMQKTPIKPETIQKINDDFANVKKIQMQEAPATEEANVAKRQNNFQKILEKSGNKTMDDLWNTAKEYDRSIKANVKNANSLSSESLQLQKDEWLQNRTILKNAINDNENGLGSTSRKAFSDMTDMYEAQNGILSKAKIETKVAPSKVGKFLKTPAGKIATGATLIGTGATAAILK